MAVINREREVVNMVVLINGEAIEINTEGELYLEELLKKLYILKDRIAIALNGHIIPKTKFNEIIVKQGDRIEIVQLMAGG